MVAAGQALGVSATARIGAAEGLRDESEDQSLPRRNFWSSSMRSVVVDWIDLVVKGSSEDGAA